MDSAVDLDTLAERAVDAITSIRRSPIADCDRGGLDTVLDRLRTVRAFCDSVDVQVARRSRHLADQGRSAPAPDVLRHRGRRSRREAEAAASREAVCQRQPGLEAALADGTVSSGHLDAIANATATLNDEQKERFDAHADSLLEQAGNEPVEAFARRCRSLARRVCRDEGESRLNNQRANNRLRHWIDGTTGMYHIHAELDPETGAKVITVLTAHINNLKHRDRDDEHRAAGEPAEPEGTATSDATEQSEDEQAADTDTILGDPTDDDARDDDEVDDDGKSVDGESSTETVAARLGRELEARLARTNPRAEPAPAASPDGDVAVQAFVELITGARGVDRRVPEVSVLIDLDTLLHGLHDDTVCETSTGTLLPPETIRRLACDGELVPIVLGGAGEVLDVGRAQRLATPAQRRALRAMYSTCGYPGCRVGFDRCEIHHVQPWIRMGRTDLANLLPVCSRHHPSLSTPTLPPESRRWLDARPPPRSHHHRHPTRRRHPLLRIDRQSGTAWPAPTTRRMSGGPCCEQV